MTLEPEEIEAVIPHGDKTLSVRAFVDLAGVDDLHFDKPYYLAPSDRSADETFELVRRGMSAAKVAAIADAVLFRRVRKLLIRPLGSGLVASTLNYDYEVRSAAQAFSGIPAAAITGEMLDLAAHIIKTKQGKFDPREFQDRYEDALAALVKLKLEGNAIPKRAPPRSAVTAPDAGVAGQRRGGARPAPKPRPRKRPGDAPRRNQGPRRDARRAEWRSKPIAESATLRPRPSPRAPRRLRRAVSLSCRSMTRPGCTTISGWLSTAC